MDDRPNCHEGYCSGFTTPAIHSCGHSCSQTPKTRFHFLKTRARIIKWNGILHFKLACCSSNCLFFSCNYSACSCRRIIAWSDLTSVKRTVPVAVHPVTTVMVSDVAGFVVIGTALLGHPQNSLTWQSSQRSQLSSGFRLDAQDTTAAFLEHFLLWHEFPLQL